ncbi:unnamed protein product, partial [Meganyctiphanes norvegica]
AIIIGEGESCGIDALSKDEAYIIWYQSYSLHECITEAVDKVPLKDLRPLNDYSTTFFNSSNDKIFRESVSEAIKDCSERADVSLARPGLFGSDIDYDCLVGWFKGQNSNIIHPNPDGDTYPKKIKNVLTIRKIMQKKHSISWKNK